jgi:transposase
MLVVETIAKIRRAYFVQGKSIKAICRELRVSRKVVRKVLRTGATEFSYERAVQPLPRIGPWKADIDRILSGNEAKSARERLTLIRIFEELSGLGYAGGYDAVRRYARSWQRERSASTADAYVPLSFAPGEAYQFDWSHEVVLINGTTVIVKVAHVRLCHSRMLFVRAYPRETQEMVFDAHDRAFAFFKGTCTRGIYDTMKTAVETIFVGKERAYNRRFLQMCGHYLVDPVACTPASGWEKGQVENQVGNIRERFFAPRLRVKNYEELNAWLLDQCLAYAKAHRHPSSASGRSLRCSRRSGRAWFPMPAASMGSMRCRHQSPRPVWCASTTTSTRSRPARSGARPKSAPMPIGSNCARTEGWSASMPAASVVTRRSSILGTTSRFWLASPVR